MKLLLALLIAAVLPLGAKAQMINSPRLTVTSTAAVMNDFAAWWSMDETGSATSDKPRRDVTTNFPVVSRNFVPSVAGKVSDAAQFTAASSQGLSSARVVHNWSTDWSLAMWVYINTTASGIVGAWQAATANLSWFLQRENATTTRFYASRTAVDQPILAGPTFASNTWTHLVITYTAKTMTVQFWINGAVFSTLTGVQLRSSTLPLVLGCGGVNSVHLPSTSRLDEVAVWPGILSPADIAALYNGGTGIACPVAIPAIPTRPVYLIAGQSNADGRCTNNQPYTSGEGSLKLHQTLNTIGALADPVGNGTGSVWPQAANNLGKQAFFAAGAVGGTSITAWLPDGTGSNQSTNFGKMTWRAQIASCYGQLSGVLWWLGETDALAAMSQATHNGHLDTIANAIGTQLGIKLMPCKLQSCSGITDADELKINDAIAEAWADNANVAEGPDLTDITTDDTLHILSDAKAITVGTRWAVKMNANLP